MEYDWRDRLTTTIVDDGTNKFQTIATLDNLGRTTVSETRRGTTSSVLIAKSETSFDTRGRVYRTKTYGVNDAGTPGNDLASNTWYDASDNVIKSQPAGSDAFTKTSYDAVNRPTNVYYGYYDGTGTDDPETLTDNTIFTETNHVYDDASNLTETTARERNHDATGTGSLNGPAGSQPKSRDSYNFSWFDAIGRMTETADYGTNGGTVPTRSATPPSSSDTIHVTQHVYHADGELEELIDPLGRTDRSEFDDAGRTVKVTLNQGGTDTEVTETEYDQGRMSKQVAVNSTTGNQETIYAWGVAPAASKIASNDLLQEMTYPDGGVVQYQYNRQSDRIKMTDPNDTVHDYELDQLGRMTEDRVTLPGGSSVDDEVLRIETVYDNRMRVHKMTSYDAASGGTVVNQVQREYNDFNQLSSEYQQPGAAVSISTSPRVQYSYENGSDNNTRMTSMTYPDGLVVNYDYGIAGNDNDQLSRVQKLKLTTKTATTEIVDYRYLGLSRVAIEKYTQPSTDLEQTIVTGSGNDPYAALDRFGRVTRLLWQQGSNDRLNTIYTYDRVGNKLTQNVNDPAALTSVDELYGYDELYRLTQYDRGELGGGSIVSPTLTQDWTLDGTGNWNNFQQGVANTLNQDRTHNQVNEITDITETVGSAWPTPAYDDNGNTTEMPQPANLTSSFDATWDAWNRLVKLQDGSDIGGRIWLRRTEPPDHQEDLRLRHPGRNASLLLQRPGPVPRRASRQFHRRRGAVPVGHPFRRRSGPARPGHQRRRHARRAAVRALRPALQRGGDHRRHRRRPGTLWLRRLRVDQHLQFFVRAPRQFQLRLGVPLHWPPPGPGNAALLLPRPLLPRPTRPLPFPRSGRLRRWHVTLSWVFWNTIC